eukprot:1477175-Alexandrium_andersonii.AAC.1
MVASHDAAPHRPPYTCTPPLTPPARHPRRPRCYLSTPPTHSMPSPAPASTPVADYLRRVRDMVGVSQHDLDRLADDLQRVARAISTGDAEALHPRLQDTLSFSLEHTWYTFDHCEGPSAYRTGSLPVTLSATSCSSGPSSIASCRFGAASARSTFVYPFRIRVVGISTPAAPTRVQCPC